MIITLWVLCVPSGFVTVMFRVSPIVEFEGTLIVAVVVVRSAPFSALFKTPSLLISSVIITVGAAGVVKYGSLGTLPPPEVN